jgi:SAM-dependent methyltransferase
MPRSTGYFKKETKNYILQKYKKDSKILDVGPGVGTYSDLLRHEGYNNIDCVEIFEPYVDDYQLKEKYNNVFVGDITELNINFDEYDLIIFGDVIEHISLPKAISLLNKVSNSNAIVAVPFDSKQGEHFGNVYETHLQDDLTFQNFFQRFLGFYPFCVRFDYGVFVKDPTNKIFVETGQNPLPTEFSNYIKDNFGYMNLHDISLAEEAIVTQEKTKNEKHNTTIVTGMWNLGRGELNSSFKRNYTDYLERFGQLLKSDIPMYIFADKSDEDFIWSIRKKDNTVVNFMSLDELKNWFEFTNKTNEIRKQEKWLSQAGWLRESPQATLEHYNPLVMSKMFMLNNVTIWNPFNTEYFFWIDGGITSTVNYGYFTHDKVFDNLQKAMSETKDFIFLSYPYEGGEEVHGFERKPLARYCNTDYVKYVCRGGFFGGKKGTINEINGLYYGYLKNSLYEGYMGTEESIFTILMHNHSDIISQYSIEGNGLVWPFFEELKSSSITKKIVNREEKNLDITKVGLYVITFNSPNQFETLIQSMLEYDENYISKTKKFLLDNSTDSSTFEKYKVLCEKYNFEHIKKDNLGICGGRQFIAEHFEKNTDLDFYLFFEDDMFFYPKKGEVCKNGFIRYVDELYLKTLEIVKKEKFDFLKLNFTEFYGNNSTQWSWYNVPQNIRETFWPEKSKLPEVGLDLNAPKTIYKNVLSHKGTPYATGEVYYCNWPQIITRQGNKKMFLDTTWAHPFEQTWMSHMYQLVKKGELNPGILLMTPTEHNRFEHYSKDLRKES